MNDCTYESSLDEPPPVRVIYKPNPKKLTTINNL